MNKDQIRKSLDRLEGHLSHYPEGEKDRPGSFHQTHRIETNEAGIKDEIAVIRGLANTGKEIAQWGMVSCGQWVATVLAVAGVLLNNSRIRWCFPLWFVSNMISLAYHIRAGLWGLAVRDAIFTVLAVAGWFQWG